MTQFSRINRLPPYVFNTMDELKAEMASRGEDLYDFGMGNPDQPTPAPIIETLRQTVLEPITHRYAASKGISILREAICEWYKNRFNVDLDPESEAIATVGSKEGLAHLALAIVDSGDVALVPDPCYPVHHYGFVMAGATICRIPFEEDKDFFETLKKTVEQSWPKPKALILNFPSNPTTQCVNLEFFQKVIKLAKENQIWVIHDLAYADITFDGYTPPSILQVPGAKDISVEFYTLSKGYNMPGWRVGFMCGNAELVNALTRIKSYIDYGSFAPVQLAAVTALRSPAETTHRISSLYQSRRDFLCQALNSIGWPVTPPKATMFLWAKIPESFSQLRSLEFAELLLKEAKTIVSPGVGFGQCGNNHVRISLVENEERILKAIQNIKVLLENADDFRYEPEPIVSSTAV